MQAIPPSLRDRRIFVDSSAYLALLDRDDAHHDEATAIVTRLADARYRHYTTNVLLIEGHALILSSLGIAQGRQFLRGIAESNTVVVRARASDEEAAQQIIYR